MKYINNFLLIYFPLVWRSNIQYFLLYSAIFGNLFFYFLGVIYPIELKDNLSVNNIEQIMWGIYSILSIPLCYWIYTQYKKEKLNITTLGYIKIYILNSIIISLLVINPISFLVPFLDNMSNLISDDVFYKKYKYHYKNNFWICNIREQAKNDTKIQKIINKYGDKVTYSFFKKNNMKTSYAAYLSNLISKNKYKELRNDTSFLEEYYKVKSIRFEKFFKTLGIDPLLKNNIKNKLSMPVNLTQKCFKTIETEDYRYPTSSAMFLFYEKMTVINEAKFFKFQAGTIYNTYISKIPQNLYIILGMNLIGALFYYKSKGNLFFLNLPLNNINLNLPKSKYFLNLNEYLLCNYPLTWSMQIHYLLYKIFALWFFIIGAIIVLFYAKKDQNITYYLLFFIMYNIPTFIWAYYQSKFKITSTTILQDQYILICHLLCVFLLAFVMSIAFSYIIGFSADHFLTYLTNLSCILLSCIIIFTLGSKKQSIILSIVMLGLVTSTIEIKVHEIISYLIQIIWLSSMLFILRAYIYNLNSKFTALVVNINLISIGIFITQEKILFITKMFNHSDYMILRYFFLILLVYVFLSFPARIFIEKYNNLPHE
jgi:hypothetical protein